HFLPDYTAYEELLSVFRSFNTIPILLKPGRDYRITAKDLTEKILGLGLSAILISNPCNPTGQVIQDNELKEWVKLARKYSCTLIFDEFYSHYIYTRSKDEEYNMVSSAEYVDNVNSDPIIIVNGLTKNWRYPG